MKTEVKYLMLLPTAPPILTSKIALSMGFNFVLSYKTNKMDVNKKRFSLI
jgi:hypothetical protein